MLLCNLVKSCVNMKLKKPMIVFLLIVTLVLLLWTIGSLLVVRNLEEPAYTILEQRTDYQIRAYDSVIVAEVAVTGDYNEGLNTGFREIADYIFGNNTTASSIAMTAPVQDSLETTPTKISMTVPVQDVEESGQRHISFVMPAQYTLETIPKPNNPQVHLKVLPRKVVAVKRFTWYPTKTRILKKKHELQESLVRDGVAQLSLPLTALYNPPASAPFILRNEIHIDVEYKKNQ